VTTNVREQLDAAPDPRTSNIPRATTSLIGRDGAVADAAALLRRGDVQLVTFSGPGGTGKTRLALEVGARLIDSFDGGTWFVPLLEVTDPETVPSVVAQVLGVRDQENASALNALAAHIGGRRLLLVLDNFEQVIASAPWLSELLVRAPTLTVLLTSRVVLRVPDEHEFPIPPLEVPDLKAPVAVRDLATYHSVKLFIERATAADASFRLDMSNAATVAEICVKLDGLPLAIELAAARVKLLPPSEILARLEHRLELVTDAAREHPRHHQTLRQAIGWSYDLLGESERRLFVRLSVFAGGCTIETATVVCDVDRSLGIDVLDGIAALLDASLLQLDARAAQQPAPRLRMLETIREFALERLAHDPQANAIRRWHKKWLLDLALRAAPKLAGPEQETWLATLASEHSNFRVALDRSMQLEDAETMLAFVAALWRYWLVRGHLREGCAWLDRALSLPADERLDALRADALTGAGTLTQNVGDLEAAAAHLSAALEVRRRLGDTAGLARVLADLGFLAWRRCEYPEAKRLSLESLELSRALGDKGLIALALSNLGWTALYEGDFAAAREIFEQGLELRRGLEDRRGVAFMLMGLEFTARRTGENERAIALAEQALPIFRAVGDTRLYVAALAGLADASLAMGDAKRARALFESDVMPIMRRSADRWSLAWVLDRFSRVMYAEDDLPQANALATESLELRLAIHDRFGIAESQAMLALLARRQDDESRARELLGESLALRREIGDRAGIAECERGLAEGERGRWEVGERLGVLPPPPSHPSPP
jgi:predicted ATPase